MNQNSEDNFTLNDFSKAVNAFSVISGKSGHSDVDSIIHQSGLLLEEAEETIDGAELNDPNEVLDGVVDVLFVALGLVEKLEAVGINVSKAMQLVSKNNASKFTDSPEIAAATVQREKDKRVDTVVHKYGNYFVIKNKWTDKVIKPVGFVSVDLSECIPDELKERGFVKAHNKGE